MVYQSCQRFRIGALVREGGSHHAETPSELGKGSPSLRAEQGPGWLCVTAFYISAGMLGACRDPVPRRPGDTGTFQKEFSGCDCGWNKACPLTAQRLGTGSLQDAHSPSGWSGGSRVFEIGDFRVLGDFLSVISKN